MEIVLLPGMDGSGEFFADFTSELKAKSAVVSYPANQPLGYDGLTKLVRTSLPRDRPFILLAESFSGPVAIALAAESPPQLRAVVLVCSFARLPEFPFHSILRRFATSVPLWRAPTSIAAHVLLGRFRTVAIEEKLRKITRSVSVETWKTRVRAALAANETSALSRLQAPLLYLRASEDRVIFRSASTVIVERVPHTKVVEIEGPHFLLQAKPRESAAAVRAFASEHGLAL